jgi:hypothetical protein
MLFGIGNGGAVTRHLINRDRRYGGFVLSAIESSNRVL